MARAVAINRRRVDLLQFNFDNEQGHFEISNVVQTMAMRHFLTIVFDERIKSTVLKTN